MKIILKLKKNGNSNESSVRQIASIINLFGRHTFLVPSGSQNIKWQSDIWSQTKNIMKILLFLY